jgi:hypothetical protein
MKEEPLPNKHKGMPDASLRTFGLQVPTPVVNMGVSHLFTPVAICVEIIKLLHTKVAGKPLHGHKDIWHNQPCSLNTHAHIHIRVRR